MSNGRLLVTGDLHFPIDVIKLDKLTQMGYSKNDTLLICGDYGGVWYPRESAQQKARDAIISRYPFQIAWCDGNHENFDSLSSYPIIQRFGSQVHMITNNCYHLLRGHVYKIQNKRVLSFGGAKSMDKHMRTEGISWWAQELPSQKDIDTSKWQLRLFQNEVDFIITHDAPASLLYLMYGNRAEILPYNELFEKWLSTIAFKNWFFGHHHIDCTYVNSLFAQDQPQRLNFNAPLIGLYNAVLDITGDSPVLVLG